MIEDILDRKYEIVLGVLLLIGSLNTVMAFSDLVAYDYDIDYSEGFFIEDVQRLTGSGSLYVDPSLENGFESVKYPPLFYLAFGALAEIIGYGFLAGRLLSIAGGLASFMFIYLIAREKTGKDLLVTPLLFLVPYLTLFSSVTIRTDMVALALSLGGVYMFTKDRVYGSMPFFVLSALTKQTFLAGFAAVFLYMFSQKISLEELQGINSANDVKQLYIEYSKLWNFGAIYGIAGLASIALLQIVYPHFMTNIFASNVGGFELRFDLLNWLHLTFLPVFGLAAYYIYIFRDRLLGFYLGSSSFFMLFQMTRGGAWIHSAVEPFAVAVICCSVLYEKLKPIKVHRTVSLLLVVQAVIFLQAPFVSGNVFDVRNMDEINREADSRLSEEVAKQDKVYTEHAGYLVTNDRQAPVEIWGMYEQYSSGGIDKEEVRTFFREKNYSSIAAYKRPDNLPIKEYLEQNYKVVDTVERRDLLLNREEWRIYRWTG